MKYSSKSTATSITGGVQSDQDGDVLVILVQKHRDKKAAKKFFRKLLKGLRCVPNVIITDRLRSYSAAKAEVLPSVEQRCA